VNYSLNCRRWVLFLTGTPHEAIGMQGHNYRPSCSLGGIAHSSFALVLGTDQDVVWECKDIARVTQCIFMELKGTVASLFNDYRSLS
jgi:hypothetical protein